MKLVTTGTKWNLADMYCVICSRPLRSKEVTWSFMPWLREASLERMFHSFSMPAAVQRLIMVPSTATTCIYT